MQITEDGSNFSNLSALEQTALRDLENDRSIVIKSADKGSAVVTWDREDYLKEADSQLSDSDVYEECETDPLLNLQSYRRPLARLGTGGILWKRPWLFPRADARLGRF